MAERGRGPRPDILRQSRPTPCVRRSRTSRVTAFEISWSTARSVLAVRGDLRSDERTFAAIAYHLTQDDVVSVAALPLIYAAAMAASALAALGSRLAGSSIALKVVPCWPTAACLGGASSSIRRHSLDRHRRDLALERGRWSARLNC